MSRFGFAVSASRAGLLAAAAVSTLALCTATRAYATLELTGWNGYYIASDLYRTTGAQIGIHNSYQYGARLGLFPNKKFGIEGSWGHTTGNMVLYSHTPAFNPANDPLGTLTVDQFDGNFIFQQERMGNPKATGFFTIGFGATDFQADTKLATGNKSNTRFAWNIGIGTKYAMSERLALRLDARYRVTDTNVSTSSGIYCDIYGYCYQYNTDWYDSGELSGGLTYSLGGSH